MARTLTHVGADNTPKMVDVSGKVVTRRQATAVARMRLPAAVLDAFEDGQLVTPKGPVFHTAIIAATQAVKKTSDLIPFCHPLPIEHCRVSLRLESPLLIIECEVATTARTGVEMEALTGASVAALTVYDMAKALSHEMVIEEIALLAKSGGNRDIDRRAGAAS